MGHPSEVADSREALGKDVLQEASQELPQSQGHAACLVVMGIVFPAERDMRFVYRQETLV
jgi:hypothetical protein